MRASALCEAADGSVVGAVHNSNSHARMRDTGLTRPDSHHCGALLKERALALALSLPPNAAWLLPSRSSGATDANVCWGQVQGGAARGCAMEGARLQRVTRGRAEGDGATASLEGGSATTLPAP
jgi:hypothetical protein